MPETLPLVTNNLAKRHLTADEKTNSTPISNPFTVDAEPPTELLAAPSRKQHHSMFGRILVTFFLLSIIPITLSAILTAATYQGSVRLFLPERVVTHIETILVAQYVLLLLMMVILVVFAGSLIASSLVRPLKRLLELTQLVGAGKLEYQLTASRPDEVGELTDAFNTMIVRLREQQARERLISQMKSEFISIAAHQLRTPLSAVKWTIKMMSDGDVGSITPEQKEFLLRGYEVNERMIALVGDLLNVARIEEGRFGYNFLPTDFIAYLKQYVDRYHDQAQRAAVTINIITSITQLEPLNIDASKMDLVLQNILDNAIKYSHPGSLITITITVDREQVSVAIADHGVGIPENQLHRVFTKFFRGDNVVRMQTEGSGLGLFIVKNIVRNHGGDVHIDSKENKGTTVTFTIPLSKEKIPAQEITFEDFVGNL